MDFSDPGTLPEVEATGKRGPRLRRSCELCRSTKGRCIPSEEDSKQCQRCLKEGKQCVFLEAKPRPKRAKNSRIRVAEMEEKLDGIIKLITSHAPSTPDISSQAVVSEIPATSTHLTLNSSNRAVNTSEASMQSPNFEPFRGPPLPMFIVPNFDIFEDVISKGMVTSNHAEVSLQYFRSKVHKFPFVLVPPNISLDSLRRDRPVLLLAILSFAAETNLKLQQQLELELRQTLSKRLIMDGEKSLDLLQGLLVYLAWYHFYFEPARHQIYQLSQMAATMTVDLEIDKPVLTNAVYKYSQSAPLTCLTKLSPEELESRRAFLGCYYMTSSICNGLRKPNSLKYSDYMGECAETLARLAESDFDYIIPCFIQLQRLAEEINQAFSYDTQFLLPESDAVRIEILMKSFEQRLTQIEATFPQMAWDNVSVAMFFYNLRIFVNEVSLHCREPSEAETISGTALRSWYHSAVRNESLIRCVQATKDYLDKWMSLSSTASMDCTLPDFIQLAYAVLVLGTITTKLDSPMIDAMQMQQVSNFDYYVTALSDKMAQLISTSTKGSNEYLVHLHGLFLNLKTWYYRLTLDTTRIGCCVDSNTKFSFIELFETIIQRCLDVGELSSSSNSTEMSEISSSDQWQDILGWGTTLDPSTLVIDGSNQ